MTAKSLAFRAEIDLRAEHTDTRKTASLLHLLAGPVGHVAVNAAGRAAHHGSNLAEFMAHRGFQHGASGSAIAPLASRAVKAIAGPEATATYEAARAAGKALYDMPHQSRQQVMQAISAGSQLAHPAVKHISNSPVLGDVLSAVRHDVAGTSPQLKSKGFLARLYSSAVDRMSRPTQTPFDAPGRKLVQNAIGGAPLAAMAAADPLGSAAHFGFNTAREVLGKSSLGKRVMEQNLKKGLSGVPMSAGKQLAFDIGASPAFLDPYRLGLAGHNAGIGEAVMQQVGDTPISHLPNILKNKVTGLSGVQPSSLSHIRMPEVAASAPIQKAAFVQHTEKMAASQKCLSNVLRLVDKNPSLKVMTGPPDRGNDTRHFWAVDHEGNIHDPTFNDYSRYSEGKPLNMQANDKFLNALRDKTASYRPVGGGFEVHDSVPLIKSLPSDPAVAKHKLLSAIAAPTKEIPHPNVLVPKKQLDLDALGFSRSRLALPLKHEKTLFPVTYRSGELHAHELPDHYLVHRDSAGLGSLAVHVSQDLLPALTASWRGTAPQSVREMADYLRDGVKKAEDARHELYRTESVLYKDAGLKEWAQSTSPMHAAWGKIRDHLAESGKLRDASPAMMKGMLAMGDFMSADRAISQRLGLLKTKVAPIVREVTDFSAEEADEMASLMAMRKKAELAEDGVHRLQGRIDFQGLPVAIENVKGSVRSGTDGKGKKWRTVMKAPYGYLDVPAKGKDGDSLDVYVGPDRKAPNAFVVHQHKPDGTGHDEDKILLGCRSAEEAKKLYLKHYDSPKFLGPVSEVPVQRLKKLVMQDKQIDKLAKSDFEDSKGMQPGDVLLTRLRTDNSPVLGRMAKALEFLQGSSVQHASLYAGKGKVVHAFPGQGVVELPLQEFQRTHEVEVRRVQVPKKDRDSAAKFVQNAVGRGYSYIDFLRAAAPGLADKDREKLTAQDKSDFICSGLVAAAYPRVDFGGRAASVVRPVDIQQSPLTKKVAGGSSA